MIDPKRIRDDYESIETGLKNRQYELSFLERYAKLDQDWRDGQQQLDTLRHEQKLKTPKKGKPSPEDLASLKALSEKVKTIQETVQSLEEQAKDAALYLPNVPSDDTPVGASEDDNQHLTTVGELPTFAFTPKPHEVLASDLDLVDFERSTKVSGSRFVTYTGLGARLERAVINFMLDTHTQQHGYTEMMPPALVHSGSMRGTGQLPKFAHDSFKITDTDLWLSPTSEVQLTNFHAGDILDEADLPKKFTAFTPCFRKEAGSHGRDTKGLIRLHQFNKVELVNFTTPEQSKAAHDALTQCAEAILTALELPYQKIILCSGDLGYSAVKTYDLEVWFPSQDTYREISSCSNFYDFQARRAMIRYRRAADGKVGYLHTLNGSGLAVGRTVAALLENGQQADGSIRLPAALHPYFGDDSIRA